MYGRRLFSPGSFACACLALLTPHVAAAQTLSLSAPQTFDPPAGIIMAGRGAAIVRGDTVTPAARDLPLVPGDRIRTARDGAALLTVNPRTVLRLGDESEIALVDATTLRLVRGQVTLLVDGWPLFKQALAIHNTPRLTLEAPGGTIGLITPGDYEVTASGELDSTAVLAHGGLAVLESAGQKLLLQPRRQAGRLQLNQEPKKMRFAPREHRGDSDDVTWVALKQLRERKGLWSAHYLPHALTTQAPLFETTGDWLWDDTYGYYWMPRVDPSWQPFTNGAWTQTSTFGWVWLGTGAPWEGPTHHYGRWAWLAPFERWAWLPGQEWSPGWVAWADAPDYVAWCPLGWDGNPTYTYSSEYWDDDVWRDEHRRRWSFSRRGRDAHERRAESSGRPAFAASRPTIVVQPARHPPAPVAAAVPRDSVAASAGGGAVPRLRIDPPSKSFDEYREEISRRHAYEQQGYGRASGGYEGTAAPPRHGSRGESSTSSYESAPSSYSSSGGSSGAVARSGSSASGSSGAVARSGGSSESSSSSSSSSSSESSSRSSGSAPRRHPR